ncbi:MAG: glutathione S-transferase family protein [Gammaproteobacteria bacterium]|nr:glutathione S-transferase family protein [Gammaproteobacteria bacterium]MDH5802897.1 glutathione S-transferase family protein [Gammaproteobacteria bacterium]
MTPELKLISFALCPFVQRALIVLAEKGLPHQIEYIDLDSPPPWFYDVSPLEKVPVLLVDKEPLFESIPIIEFIDDISPGSLYPSDPMQKAKQKAWMEFGNDILSSVYSYYTTTDAMLHKQQRNTIVDRLDTLEEFLSDGPFFSGAEFSMVDAVYAPLFRYLSVLSSLSGEDFFDDLPAIKKWSEELLKRNSVLNSVPASYPDEIIAYVRSRNSVFSAKLS